MRLLILLLSLFAGCAGRASAPTHDQVRAMTLRLGMQLGGCSGTSVGPHEILTATHCFYSGGALRMVDGQPVNVLVVVDDRRDHSTVTVDMTFQTWAHFGPSPRQGMRVRWWGNPHGEPDVYREGVVSQVKTDRVLIDATVCSGDSGAALFNDAGEIVGVISGMNDRNGCTFMMAKPKA